MEDSLVLLGLLEQETDNTSLDELKKEIQNLTQQLKKLELKSFLNGPQDKNNCYMAIHAGAGGTEAEDWAGILQRMYFKWAEEKHFSIEILSLSAVDSAGIRSVQCLIKGPFCLRLFKSRNRGASFSSYKPF